LQMLAPTTVPVPVLLAFGDNYYRRRAHLEATAAFLPQWDNTMHTILLLHG